MHIYTHVHTRTHTRSLTRTRTHTCAHRAPEVLFDPNLMGLESKGIHHLVHDTINKCDIDVRRELYNNIVLSGGTSMFEGMQTRWL